MHDYEDKNGNHYHDTIQPNGTIHWVNLDTKVESIYNKNGVEFNPAAGAFDHYAGACDPTKGPCLRSL